MSDLGSIYRNPAAWIISENSITVTVLCPYCGKEHIHFNKRGATPSICMAGHYDIMKKLK